MKGLRILFALETYPPEISGLGKAVQRLANGLVSRGYKVGVVCPGTKLTMEVTQENGVTVFRLGSLPLMLHKGFRFAPLAGSFMDTVFDEFKPDVVHLEDHFSTGLAALTESEWRDIPAVGTNHFHPDNLLHYLKAKKGSNNYRMLVQVLWRSFRFVYRQLAVVTTPTQTAADILKENGFNHPVRAVSNGIDLSLYKRTASEEAAKRRQAPGHVWQLVTVGRVEQEKRFDVLIKMVSFLPKELPLQLVIVGKGQHKPVLEKLVGDLTLGQKVKFAGALSDEELRELYANSDILVTASEVELQGLTIMEGMAYGLPVVATKAMAIPELVHEGVNGWLFAPGDAAGAAEKVKQIINDSRMYERFSQQALVLIAKHDFQRTLDAYEEIYQQARQLGSGMRKKTWKWRLVEWTVHYQSQLIVSVIGGLIIVLLAAIYLISLFI
ncbi:MAG: glycosyltransferase [Candidatus Andersenbacteria bacterium]|nr:glycosyltransferase [bacterium]MDZ4225441.1 glycosyltransferase [Candidatus Andersenbacteria bacterium]